MVFLTISEGSIHAFVGDGNLAACSLPATADGYQDMGAWLINFFLDLCRRTGREEIDASYQGSSSLDFPEEDGGEPQPEHWITLGMEAEVARLEAEATDRAMAQLEGTHS